MKSKRIKKDTQNQVGAKSNAAFFAFITFAAVISVLILGYLRFSDTGKAVIEVEGKKSDVVRAQDKIKDGIQAKLPETRAEMFYPSANSIEGRWYAKIGESGIAEIDLDGENFELVYVQTPQDRIRKFSKGTYKYSALTGNLELSPKGGETPREIKGVGYQILTMRNFKIQILKKKDDPKLYYTAHEYDVPGKTYHPIFLYDDYAGSPVLEFNPVVISSETK